jgi:uncharacterized protein
MDAFEALKSGDIVALTAALEADPSAANTAGPDGATLLSFAAYMGNKDAIAAIRAVHTNLSPWEAITVGDVNATKAAVVGGWDANARSPDGFTPLSLACFFRHRELVDLLLPLTSDVNARAENSQQVAALHAAAAARDSVTVEKLLRKGADPNLEQQGGFRALHTAAQHDDVVMAGLLVLAGANPALTNSDGLSAIGTARAAGRGWLADRLAAL